MDCPDESGACFGGSETASEGMVVGEGIDCRAAQGRSALSAAWRARRQAASVGVSDRAQSKTAHLLCAPGEPRRAFRREGAARLFDTGKTHGRAATKRAEDPDDQRLCPEGSGSDRVVRSALADRTVLQGIEEHTGIRSVPLSQVQASRRLARHDAGDVPLFGMVPRRPTGPYEPVQGRKGPLASSTHVWPVCGHCQAADQADLDYLAKATRSPGGIRRLRRKLREATQQEY